MNVLLAHKGNANQNWPLNTVATRFNHAQNRCYVTGLERVTIYPRNHVSGKRQAAAFGTFAGYQHTPNPGPRIVSRSKNHRRGNCRIAGLHRTVYFVTMPPTPLDPQVREAMLPYRARLGNPRAVHRVAIKPGIPGVWARIAAAACCPANRATSSLPSRRTEAPPGPSFGVARLLKPKETTFNLRRSKHQGPVLQAC